MPDSTTVHAFVLSRGVNVRTGEESEIEITTDEFSNPIVSFTGEYLHAYHVDNVSRVLQELHCENKIVTAIEFGAIAEKAFTKRGIKCLRK